MGDITFESYEEDDGFIDCSACHGTGINIEGTDCEECDGTGYREI